jgi:hypothetical protein
MNAILVRVPFSDLGRQFERNLGAVRAGVEAFLGRSVPVRDREPARHGGIPVCLYQIELIARIRR